MEELQNKLNSVIVRSSKLKLSKALGISRPHLDKRLKLGGWTNAQIDLINNLDVDDVREIYDTRKIYGKTK